ncbi:MAG: hypothetical protein FJ284_08145 [Planctomycetes bacterium]|nr:hypothetical protein [Planctomycetota bacterium]
MLAELYQRPGVFDRPEHELPGQAPNACEKVKDWEPLVARMFEVGMLKLLDPRSTPVVAGVRASAALFGVAKKDSELLRVILDRRRRNCMEKSLDRVITEMYESGQLDDDTFLHLLRLVTLPHPCQLVDLVLKPSDRVLISSEDVAEFYHSLEWPEQRWPENAVGSLVRPSSLLGLVSNDIARRQLLDIIRLSGDAWLQPALSSPGMGDQKASGVAQSFAQHLMYERRVFSESSWMTYGYPAPLRDLWVGSYIDDALVLKVFGQLEVADDSSEDAVALRNLRQAHRSAGTRLHENKRVFRQEVATVWGAHIDGLAGVVRGEPGALHQLIRITCEVIGFGRATPHMIMCLSSSWTHFMMFFRQSMCIFQDVYGFSRLTPLFEARTLPSEVCEELLSACILAPLFMCQCKSPLNPCVFASDATTKVGAVVVARPSDLEVAWLHCRLPRRGSYTRLFAEQHAEDDPDPDVLYKSDVRDQLLYDFVAQLQFEPVHHWKLAADQHIGLQEFAALSMALRRAAKDTTNWGTRLAMLVDARVVRHALMRGRSSSRALNACLRRLMPHLLCTGLRPLIGWVPTDVNAADDPTRHLAVRCALPRSDWVREALERFVQARPRVLEVVRAAGDCPVDVLLGGCGGRAPMLAGGLEEASLAVRYLENYPRERRVLQLFGERSLELERAVARRGGALLHLGEACLGRGFADPRVLHEPWLGLIKEGFFGAVVALPCFSSFCPSAVPAASSSRSRRFPLGGSLGRPLSPLEQQENDLLALCCQFLAAADYGLTAWILLAPAGSLMWQTPPVQVARRGRGARRLTALLDWCRFQLPWRHRTRLLGTLPGLRQLGRLCRGGHQHDDVFGSTECAEGLCWHSPLACRLSGAFCRSLAVLLCDDSSAYVVARYGLRGRRIGEAALPGPVRVRGRVDAPVLTEGVLPTTLARYDTQLQDLEQWMGQHRLGNLASLSTSDERVVNAVLAARLQQLAAENAAVYRGGDLLSGFLRRYPWYRGRLAEAWHSFAVWNRAVPHFTRLALDYRILRALVCICLLWRWTSMASLLMLGFHGLLRPAEMAALKRVHVRLPHDGVGFQDEAHAVVCIVRAKTRTRAASTQSVLVEDALALQVAAVGLLGLHPNQLILAGGSAHLRLLFSTLLECLNLGHLAYSPSSLRPGGALHLFSQKNCSLADLMYRGRWDSSRTVSHYLQEGFAALAVSVISAAAAQRVRALSDLLPEVVAEWQAERLHGGHAPVRQAPTQRHAAGPVTAELRYPGDAAARPAFSEDSGSESRGSDGGLADASDDDAVRSAPRSAVPRQARQAALGSW